MKVFKMTIDDDESLGMFTNSFVEVPAHMKGFQTFGKKSNKIEYFANDEKQIVSGVMIAADKLINRYDESIGL